VLYCTARGVEKNLEEAVRWYERAAENQHEMAMYNLGVMLMQGMGVEADAARGEKLIKDSGIAPQGVGKAPPAANG
jgi:TPR repeat protein